MIEWLTSETGTYVFIATVLSLYIGFATGLLINSFWVERDIDDDDDDGGDEWGPDAWPTGDDDEVFVIPEVSNEGS